MCLQAGTPAVLNRLIVGRPLILSGLRDQFLFIGFVFVDLLFLTRLVVELFILDRLFIKLPLVDFVFPKRLSLALILAVVVLLPFPILTNQLLTRPPPYRPAKPSSLPHYSTS